MSIRFALKLSTALSLFVPLPAIAQVAADSGSVKSTSLGLCKIGGNPALCAYDALVSKTWVPVPITPANLPTVTLEKFGGFPAGIPGVNSTDIGGTNGPWAQAMAMLDLYPYGGKLVLLSGAYNSSTQLVAHITDGKNLTAEGQGCAATRLHYTGAATLPLVYAGATTSDTGHLVLRGFGFYSPLQTAANAVAPSGTAPEATAMAMEIANRPRTVVDGVCVETNYNQGVYVVGSYASIFQTFLTTSVTGSGLKFAPDGGVNGLQMVNSGFYHTGSATVAALIIPGVPGSGVSGNGIGIRGLNLEQSTMQMSDVSGVNMSGFYAEIGNTSPAGTQQSLVCTANCANVTIDGGWLGAQDAVMTWANFTRTRVNGVKIYNRTITYDQSATDFELGTYSLQGTASITNAPPPNIPTLQNSWTNAGGSNSVAGYRLHGDGTVSLQGTLVGGSANSIAFTLPADYRPFSTRYFIGQNSAGTAAGGYVTANGSVVITTAPSGVITLDGVRFDK